MIHEPTALRKLISPLPRLLQADNGPCSSKLWQNMFKRGLTSSDVLPSTVSSTTAQGFLPQFTGHAAASLSPTRESPSKVTGATCNGTSTFMTQKTTENCPPPTIAATGERLSDTLLNMVGIKTPTWTT